MNRSEDPRIPEVGTVPQGERMFRVNWVANEFLDRDLPSLSADFVSRQGRYVRIVDVRSREELVAELGYVRGTDWVPQEDLVQTLEPLGRDEPIVIVSRNGSQSAEAVAALRDRGFRFVAAMHGGIWAWRDLGYIVSHDRSILERARVLRPIHFRWEPASGPATRKDVESHVGDPLSIRWVKLAALLVHGRISCVDGRDGTGVIGTPGGDAGEFVLLLSAYERVTGRHFSAGEVHTLLGRRIAEFGRFYAHSDVDASNRMISSMRTDRRFDKALEHVFHALEWRKFMAGPPREVHEALVEHTTNPAHIGCGHLRLSMQHAAAYGTRPELVAQTLSALWQHRWNGEIDVEYTVLPGGHSEGGVLSVFIEDGVAPFQRIPLISPSSGDRQFFVAHPQVAGFLREQQVAFLRRQSDLAPLTVGEAEQMTLEIHALGERQTAATLGALAKGLPLFQLRFGRELKPRVIELGTV